MLRSISLGQSISVTGAVVEILADGQLAVKIGSKLFTGHPALLKSGSTFEG